MLSLVTIQMGKVQRVDYAMLKVRLLCLFSSVVLVAARLDTSGLTPLLTFPVDVDGQGAASFAYLPGMDPARSVGMFLRERGLPSTKELMDVLHERVLMEVKTKHISYNSNEELFSLPINMGELQGSITVRADEPILLIANAFCLENLGILDDEGLSVAVCTETVVGLCDVVHDQVLKTAKVST